MLRNSYTDDHDFEGGEPWWKQLESGEVHVQYEACEWILTGPIHVRDLWTVEQLQKQLLFHPPFEEA